MTVMEMPLRPGVGIAPPRPHVRIQHLRKTYNAYIALEDINLDLRPAEFIGVLGPSGCGKSTLLKCVAGLTPIESGVIEIHGQTVTEPPNDMAIVFQRDILLDWRRVLDNILLPIEFKRQPKAKWTAKALELLEVMGLKGLETRYPWELSGGQRQRVAICRALIQSPSLLLMDEPFGALDALTRDELNLELQRVWMQTHKSVLFITHGITEAIFLSDRVVVMAANPGRILEVIDIDLPRPRTLDMRETPEFGRYAKHIRHLFENLGVLKGRP